MAARLALLGHFGRTGASVALRRLYEPLANGSVSIQIIKPAALSAHLFLEVYRVGENTASR